MSRVSTRYAWHVLALVALLSLPVYRHATGRSYLDDCARPEGLLETFDFDTPHPVEQRTKNLNINRIQWTEGEIDVDVTSEARLAFTVARSFRPTSLLLGFDKLQPGVIEPERIEVLRRDVDGDVVEIHLLAPKAFDPASMGGRGYDGVRMAAYMTIYDHRATANPFRAQLSTALAELFSSLPPVTMYFLYGELHYQDLPAAEARAEAWLTDAWRQYRATCLP